MQKHLTDNLPLVSVVIPVFNGENFITECLDSVYSQTYSSIEVIIVDDGSLDNSLKIIDEYTGPKTIITQKNGDVSQARNTGVKNAKGDLIAFLDQDDIWIQNKLQKQVELFIDNPQTDLIFTDLIKVYPSGKQHHAKDKNKLALSLTDSNLFSKLVRKNVLMPSTVMVKKKSFVEAGYFDGSFKTCGDYEMWIRMAALGMVFRYLSEPLILYRQHEKNTSKKTFTMYEDRLKVMKKTFSNLDLNSDLRKLERVGFAAAYMEGAHSFFSIKNYKMFLENANWAFSRNKKVLNHKFITRYIRSWLHDFIK